MKDLKQKIAIVCVNYNSYNSLYTYLKSISKAALFDDKSSFIIDVYIADNSTQKQKINGQFSNINIYTYDFNNIGYFKAAFNIINNYIYIDKYEYICISNVDLELDKSFFIELARKNYNENAAWIAPSIYSLHENKGRNPATLYRRSKFKMSILQLMYRYPILYMIYKSTIYKTKNRDVANDDILDIYAGHGSFIILTRPFLQVFSNFEFPLFLYGEELFLAEHIRLIDMKVIYDNSLLIIDSDHVSTKHINYKFIANYNYEAVKYIINEFY